MNWKAAALLVGILLSGATEHAFAADDRQAAEYWLERAPQRTQLLMDGGEIENYNERLREKQPTVVYDLTNYPAQITQTELNKLLKETQLPEGFVNGAPPTPEWQRQVMLRLNSAAIKPVNAVAYGLVVARANLRAAPTATPIFETASDREFDQLQSTILNPGEGVAVLQRSADGLWLFVQSSTYRGWLSAELVAMVERAVWQEYLTSKSFAIVTASHLELTVDGKRVLLEMGGRLPLTGTDGGMTVRLPQRDATGQARFVDCKLPANADVHSGYLPYTTENVLRQAFKFKGQPYGWGGLKESVDCSSLVMDVYRCFGFALPRDADQQETAYGKTQTLTPGTAAQALDAAKPGSALYMPGHTMLYLGKADGAHYVIHSLGSAGALGKDGKWQRLPVMQVVVSDLNMPRKSGRPFLDGLTTVKEMAE